MTRLSLGRSLLGILGPVPDATGSRGQLLVSQVDDQAHRTGGNTDAARDLPRDPEVAGDRANRPGFWVRNREDEVTRQQVRPGTARRGWPYLRRYRAQMVLLLGITAGDSGGLDRLIQGSPQLSTELGPA